MIALAPGPPLEKRPIWRPGPDFPFDLIISLEPWIAAGFLFSSFVTGMIWSVVLGVMLALGLSLSVVLIGIPLLMATLALTRYAARTERWRVRLFYGVEIPDPPVLFPPGTWLERGRLLASDRSFWQEILYMVLLFPLCIVEFALVCIAVFLPLMMVMAPLYYRQVSPEFFGWQINTLFDAVLATGIGLALAIPAVVLVVMAGRAHVELARTMLARTSVEVLQQRVAVLTKSRTAVIDAQLAERRRIERDLHDGAQQRLVALAMTLGMAREQMAIDPAAARPLIESAHDEVKQVLAELRELVRGIHPAVLSDRGLDAAISAVAGRSPVPVTVDVRLENRLPEPVEAAAYFVVIEALANVARHSTATSASVAIWREHDRLLIEVRDNGSGGANPANGTGLTGLADRLAAFDGWLMVESPAGGGTRLWAEVPCG